MSTLPRLTLRKVEILWHLEAGRSYKEIAGAIGIHEDTVRDHVLTIARDLPGNGAPKDRVMLWCDRLLVANADVVANVRRRTPNGNGTPEIG